MDKAIHKEQVKANLRMAFGTLRAFEIKAGLKADSVRDVLRGRASARAEQAIAETLNQPIHSLFPHRYAAPVKPDSSTKRDDTRQIRDAHRLSAERG